MIRFLSQVLRNYQSTGAIAPSTPFLAHSMVKSIFDSKSKRILEVGCGTGAFTKAILKKLSTGDELHIVEVNDIFCKDIENRILKPFRQNNPDIPVYIHNELLENAPIEGCFDSIICGLPFNNFPLLLVENLFSTMLNHLKEGGELAYFEYLGVRSIKTTFGTSKLRKETANRTADINLRIHNFNGSINSVWPNFPPCRVIRLRK